MNMKRIISALAIVMLFSSVCSAHDMWLEKKGHKVHLMYGHPGVTDPYPIDRITAMTGITEDGWKVALEPLYNKGEAYAWLNDSFSMLTVEFDNKYWFNTEEGGWQNFGAPRAVCGKIIDQGSSYKLSKCILKWMPGMDKPIGQRAELVPLKDPTKLKEGDMLPVMMYIEGKPAHVKGARISATSDRNIEDPELIDVESPKPFMVKIGPKGRQIIVGKFEKRLDDTRRVWFAFSLTFRTGK